MNILHSAISLRPVSGIVNQMNWEQEVANHLGLNWTVKIFCPNNFAKSNSCKIFHFPSLNIIKRCNDGISKNIYNWIRLRVAYYRWLKSEESKVDIFLLRHYSFDIFELLFIIKCTKPVYLVHHTLEVEELRLSKTPICRIQSLVESIVGSISIRKAFGIIGVTEEIIAYEKKRSGMKNKISFHYPNGILYTSCILQDRRGVIPEFIFIASHFAPWHGLDILISYIKKSKKDFILHLVGKIEENDEKKIKNESRIILHGTKTSDEIRYISEQCWVGLSSFALYRKRMNEACTLKVREYLMLGLPVYANYIEVFPKKFPYYHQGPPDIDKIIEYAYQVRNTLRDEVAECARPFIDKKEILQSLYLELVSR